MGAEDQNKSLIEVIREIAGKTANRRAPYFIGWDQKSTEVSVLESWIIARGNSNPRFKKYRHCREGEDPPDFLLWDAEGRQYGLELTELVDQKLLERQLKGKPQGDPWGPEQLRSHALKAIANKDEKMIGKWGGVPYGCTFLILLLYTDEPLVDEASVAEALPERKLCSAVFSEVHLLASPAPSTKGIPFDSRLEDFSPSGGLLWTWPTYRGDS